MWSHPTRKSVVRCLGWIHALQERHSDEFHDVLVLSSHGLLQKTKHSVYKVNILRSGSDEARYVRQYHVGEHLPDRTNVLVANSRKFWNSRKQMFNKHVANGSVCHLSVGCFPAASAARRSARTARVAARSWPDAFGLFCSHLDSPLTASVPFVLCHLPPTC